MQHGERQRARSAARVPVQVERLEPGRVRRMRDPVELGLQRVVGRRHRGTAVDLELLQHRTDVAAESIEQRSVPHRDRHQDPREEHDRDRQELGPQHAVTLS